MDDLVGQRVLVTGGSGFIGSHLVDRLLEHGARVHVITSEVSSLYPIRLVPVQKEIALHEANLLDRGALDGVVRAIDPEIVFHLAAYTHVGKSWQRISESIQTNVQGTANLLESLSAWSSYRRMVSVGTSEIYGQVPVPFREDRAVAPSSPYAITKHAAEQLCRATYLAQGSPIVLVRPFNAYGPRQTMDRVIPELIVRLMRGEEVRMTGGTQTREFNYVTDTVDGLVAAGTAPGVDGRLFNLGCGVETTIRALAEQIASLVGRGSVAIGQLPDRPNEIWRMFGDSQQARALLGWKASVPLDVGLEKTVAWFHGQIAMGGSPYLI